MAMIKVRHLTKRFNGICAVDDVSFVYDGGGILGIAGPNGSGKTTLLNLLSGSILPDAGEIWFDGRRIDKLSLAQRARFIAARTYQDGRVWPNHTVAEHLQLTLWWGGGTLNGDLNLDAALDKVGLRSKRDEQACTLSFGQRRRLELARTLLRSGVPLYLFDEPSSGGDPGFAETLSESLQQLKSLGKYVIIVEHNLELLLRVVDELLILESGRVLAQGTPTEVLKRPDVATAYLGMNEAFQERFDIDPRHSRKQHYEIEREKVPYDIIQGTQGALLLRKENVKELYRTRGEPEPWWSQAIFEEVDETLTVEIMAHQSYCIGAVSMDFGCPGKRFTVEEARFLEGMIGSYWGHILRPFLITSRISMEAEERGEETPVVMPQMEGISDQADRIRRCNIIGIKYGMVYNASEPNSYLQEQVFVPIDIYRNTKTNVIVLGETGTGKELVVIAITGGDFQKVNCNELKVPELIPFELFGREKGALGPETSSRNGRIIGKAEQSKDTLINIYLNEIGKAIPTLQDCLLGVLDNGEFQRPGSDGITKLTNIRFISATQDNLDKLINQDEFKKELYYRLSGDTICLKPLRERREEILSLMAYFAERMCQNSGGVINCVRIAPDALQSAFVHSWPGNVRELEKAMERCVVREASRRRAISKDLLILPNEYKLDPNAEPPDWVKNLTELLTLYPGWPKAQDGDPDDSGFEIANLIKSAQQKKTFTGVWPDDDKQAERLKRLYNYIYRYAQSQSRTINSANGVLKILNELTTIPVKTIDGFLRDKGLSFAEYVGKANHSRRSRSKRVQEHRF